MKYYLLYLSLLAIPSITHATAIDGQTLWSLSANICNETNESLSKLCVIDSTLDNLSFDLDDEISIIEEIICSKIDDLATCFMITQEDIDAGFTISTSGKYCLSENVTHTSASVAITIDTDNVTINLDGHTIDGTSTATNGIATNGTRKNIIIQNGSITSCEIGINIDNTSQVCINDLIIKQSSDNAIEIANSSSIIIKNCLTSNATNSGIAISLSNNYTVKNCTAQNNGTFGFVTTSSTNGLFVNNKSLTNDNDGFLLFNANDNIIICQCIALNNSRIGFNIDTSSTNTSLIHNKSIANTITGFTDMGTNTSAFANLAHSNGTDYFGIADPIETTPTVTTGYWTNVDQ
jgi:parallel beta-helix repeat protein